METKESVHERLREMVNANPVARAAAQETTARLAFARTLREVRTDLLGLTQNEIGAILNMKQSQVAKLESAQMQRGMTFGQMERMINAYNLALVKKDKSTIKLQLSVPNPDGGQKTICLAG